MAPMKLVVVAAFVMLNAVSFLVYRACLCPRCRSSSLLTSKHHAADNLSRDAGASQAKVATPDTAAVAAEPTSEPQRCRTADLCEQPTVPERYEFSDGRSHIARARAVQRTRVKQPAHRHVDETPAKSAVGAKPAADKLAETKPAVESKPAAETKPPVETKPADKAKDKVLEMEANPYKRGE